MKSFQTIRASHLEEGKLNLAKLKKAGWPFKDHADIPKDLVKRVLDFADTRNVGKVDLKDINDFLKAVAKGQFEEVEWQEAISHNQKPYVSSSHGEHSVLDSHGTEVFKSRSMTAAQAYLKKHYNKLKEVNEGRNFPLSANDDGPQDDVRELELWADNDANLHRQMEVPIIKNYILKIIKGNYNHQQGIKGWVNYYTTVAKRNQKEIGHLISVKDRKHAALDKEISVYADIKNGNWDDLIFKDKFRGSISGLLKHGPELGPKADDRALGHHAPYLFVQRSDDDPKAIWKEIKRRMK